MANITVITGTGSSSVSVSTGARGPTGTAGTGGGGTWGTITGTIGDQTDLTPAAIGAATAAQGALADSASQPGHTHAYAPELGADDNYVTDAEKTKLSNLSGTNTGDQDLSGKEAVLGNPAATGAVLTSTDAGVRSWTAGTLALPVGASISLGAESSPGAGDQGIIEIATGGGIYTGFGGFIDTNAGGSLTTAAGHLTGPATSGTIALVDAQTHTGAHAFSSTTRPTSSGTGTPAATSLITAADGDTRYGPVSVLRLTAQTSSASTAYVDSGTTLTLGAGTYHFQGCVFGITASTTGGLIAQIKASTTVEMYACQVRATGAGSAIYLSSVSTTESAAVGTGQTFENIAVAIVDAGASNKTGKTTFNGVVILSGSTTFTPRIAQRTATDAANPAFIDVGSHIIFTKIA